MCEGRKVIFRVTRWDDVVETNLKSEMVEMVIAALASNIPVIVWRITTSPGHRMTEKIVEIRM